MIYAIKTTTTKNTGVALAFAHLQDLDGVIWRITKVELGFVLEYKGPQNSRPISLASIIQDGERLAIYNTNIFHVITTGHEFEDELLDITSNNGTMGVWKWIKSLFKFRFDNGSELRDYEEAKSTSPYS